MMIDMHVELLDDHWLHGYNWAGLSIDILAKRYNVSVDEIETAMGRIAAENPKPKPKTWRNIEFTKPCRTCGEVIGFARTEKGKFMPVNLLDRTTHWGCEKPGKRKKK